MISLTDPRVPTPPNTAVRLIELCQNRNAAIREIEEVVSTDTALPTKFWKVANPAFCGQRCEVATLSRAAIVLGVGHVKVVALGFHLAKLTRVWRELPIDLGIFWQGNLLRACLAR